MEKIFTLVIMGILCLSMFSILLCIELASVRANLGAVIDLFDNATPSGTGINQSSGGFAPQQLIILYANVTYDGTAVENKLVAFEVSDPNGNIYYSRSNATDANGIATVRFRLATGATLGTWTAIASVDVAQVVVHDTLTFQVGFEVPNNYPTIQDAINNASVGDTILVKNGTYYEHITLNKTLTIIGEDRKAIVDGNGTGNVFTVSGKASNASIAGFTIRNGSCGIHIGSNYLGPQPENLTITDNSIQNSTEGIDAYPGLAATSFNAVNNSIIGNSLGISLTADIALSGSGHASGSITGNLFLDNKIGISVGLFTSGTVIRNNLILFSTEGITFGSNVRDGSSCNLTSNLLFGNMYGIFFSGSGDGSHRTFCNNTLNKNEYATYIDYQPTQIEPDFWLFYHNNFINNTEQALAQNANITWDGGYPSEGNYWSDYLTEYPNATEIDQTGIGNIPYVINENNTDHYPFMLPFPISIPLPPLSPPLFAHFSCSPSAPVVNQTVTFNASLGLDLNGTITKYAWDFGDGANSTSTQPAVTHAYMSTGTYNVTLTVTDNHGLTNVDTQTINVGKLNSTILIRVSAATITIKKSTIISGSISPIRPGANAAIYYMLNVTGTWSVLANVTIDVNSTYSYSWIPAQPGNYLLKANWTGDQYTLPAESSTITLVCVKIATSISISTSSSSTLIGFTVDIAGRLTDQYGSGLTNEPVVLYYTSYGASSWTLITSDSTDSFGNYSVMWTPTATGIFTIKAEWAGNSTHGGTSSNVTLGSLPYENQYVFSVESNSTISALAFNTTRWELSFTASGPSGTRGYTKVTVAKSLVTNATNVRVYLDGNQLNYSIASTDDSWLLTFNYTHSTHKVSVDLNVSAIPEFPLASLLLLFMLLVMLVVVIPRRRDNKRSICKSILENESKDQYNN